MSMGACSRKSEVGRGRQGPRTGGGGSVGGGLWDREGGNSPESTLGDSSKARWGLAGLDMNLRREAGHPRD